MPTTTVTKCFPVYGVLVQKGGQDALDAQMEPLNQTGLVCATNTFTGVENRNWVKQVRSGSNATTIASGTRSEITGLPMRYLVIGYVNGNENLVNARSSCLCDFNLGISTSTATAAQIASVTNLASTKFSKDVERALTQFSGGVFLAELKETLHMIRRPAQSLRKAIGQYLGGVQKNGRRLKRRPVRERERWVSNSWLESSFGWMPALSDLDSARNYLQARQDALYQELQPVKGSASVRFLSTGQQRSFSVGIGTISAREQRFNEVTHVYAGAVSSRAYGPGLINASAMGLSPRSFVPTLWEVIPWSFLVDYFTNIGDVISGWANQHAQLAWGRSTLINARESRFIDQHGSPTQAVTKLVSAQLIASDLKMVSRSFTRAPITTPPVPGISFEIPGMGIKWINMAALVAARRNISSLRLGQ